MPHHLVTRPRGGPLPRLPRPRPASAVAYSPGPEIRSQSGDGLRYAVFYIKVHDRMLRPLMSGDQPQFQQPAPLPSPGILGRWVARIFFLPFPADAFGAPELSDPLGTIELVIE